MSMGFLDKLLGREPMTQGQQSQQAYGQAGGAARGQQTQPPAAQRTAGPQDSTTGVTPQDQQAIARYRYLLRTAPPEQIEQAHAEAFSRLSPSQRQQVLAEMTDTLPASERPQSDDPGQLARAATRAEMNQPGYLQRTFGGTRGMGGMGGMGGGMMGAIGGSLLGTVAGVVIGTSIADSLMGGFDGSPEQTDGGVDGTDGSDGTDAGGADGTDAADAGGDAGGGDIAGDSGAVETGYADAGGDQGGFGDFGGGDFGGGDLGGDFF